MLTIESINPDPQLSVALAVYFAKLALPVWQQKYPEDLRPEEALEAAEKALLSDATANVAHAASSASIAAAAASIAAAAYASVAAAHAARSAARSAAAAYASIAAANAAASVAAAHAAYAAAAALDKDRGSFIHHHLIQLLPLILLHKLSSRRSFGKPEKVFELLPEACREDFLFNLDSLR